MQQVNGVVASLRKDRQGFKVGDVWYTGAVQGFNKGDTVAFSITEGKDHQGRTQRCVQGEVTVTAKGQFNGGYNKGGYSGGGNKGGSYQKKDNADYEAGVTAGVAINNAALLVAHGKADLANIDDLARKLANLSKNLKAELKAGTALQPSAPAPNQQANYHQQPPHGHPVTQQVPQNAVPAQQPAPAPAYDSDVPFNWEAA